MPSSFLPCTLTCLLVACGGQTAATPSDASTDVVSDVAGDAADAPLPDTSIDYFSCAGPGTCVLAINDCCGPCGVPKLSDFTAVASTKELAWAAKVCTTPTPMCPECPAFTERSLLAVCAAGRCKAIDVRTDVVSECAIDGDCVLRTAECCECGGDSANPIAIAKKHYSDYAAMICSPLVDCAACAPVYPATIKPVCDPATKHCLAKRL